MQEISSLALVGGTIYIDPEQPPIHDGVVLVQENTIAAVGPSAEIQVPRASETIDCAGLTITAGFWNSHVHFTERKWGNAAETPAAELNRQLEQMLTRYGFTNAFDLSSAWENTRRIRDRIESGEVAGPRIRSTGEAILPPDGLPPDLVVSMMGWMKVVVPEVADASQAAIASRNLLSAGVDGIKLFASAQRGAVLSEAAFEAAANEAHQSGKPVFVHPNTAVDILTAVRGGVDIVAHTTPASGPWDSMLIEAMLDRSVALIPTLWIWKYYARHDRLATQEQVANTAVGQLRAWIAAGGPVLFGNDLGAVDYDPSEEYLLMSEAGMTFPQILASLTTVPAGRFAQGQAQGRVAPGFQADLTVFRGDPNTHITALTDVCCTVRGGRILYRAPALHCVRR